LTAVSKEDSPLYRKITVGTFYDPLVALKQDVGEDYSNA
jgi:hypothetical protein